MIARTVITVLNVIMVIILLACSKDMKWSRDKASIIGFGFMILLFAVNTYLIWR